MSVPSAAPSGILEQQAIREKCVHPSGVFTEFSREDLQQTVASLFERQVRKSPLRLAIQTPVQALTYEQLNAQANRLARGILSQAPHPGERVVLLLEKSATAIAALLATLKTGNISVTVEPSYTRERLRQIVSYAEAGVIVSSAGHWDLARELQGEFPRATLVNADELGANLSSTNLDLPASITLYAGGLYFTSGSTGEPKALLETRELLLYNIRTYTNDLHLTPEDRLSLVHSLTFTACHRNLFGALLNGGCLLPFDPGKEGLNQFGAWLSREAITILHCPASLFRHLEGAVPGDLQFPSVRVIYAANEPVSRTEVEFYRKRFSSRCIFVNGLGSSEVSTVCRYFVDKNTLLPCERGLSGTSEVPVGYSPEDVGLILRDEDGRQIEGEGSGELYVRSRLKIHGYWRRPDLTQATFLKDPEDSGAILYRSGDRAERFADGSITLLGREDYMLKISGRMVDPAAVERTLLGHLGVREACVTAKVGATGEPRLVAYIVPAGQRSAPVEELRGWVRERLGEHMAPFRIVELLALPRNPRGKVDRALLPDPGFQRPLLETAYIPPGAPVEREIAALWSDVLELDQIGLDDPLMDLGGSSLQAARLASAISGRFHMAVPLAIFWSMPTVRQLAAFVVQQQAALLNAEELELILAEAELAERDPA